MYLLVLKCCRNGTISITLLVTPGHTSWFVRPKNNMAMTEWKDRSIDLNLQGQKITKDS